VNDYARSVYHAPYGRPGQTRRARFEPPFDLFEQVRSSEFGVWSLGSEHFSPYLFGNLAQKVANAVAAQVRGEAGGRGRRKQPLD
jgi:hypothetical protein